MIRNFLVPAAVAVALGLFVLLSPDYFGIESLYIFLILTYIGSFLVGLIMAKMWANYWWLWPIIFAIAYPLKVIAEILQSPTSHNLWPIEMAFCIPYLLVGLLGAIISKRFWNKPTEASA